MILDVKIISITADLLLFNNNDDVSLIVLYLNNYLL